MREVKYQCLLTVQTPPALPQRPHVKYVPRAGTWRLNNVRPKATTSRFVLQHATWHQQQTARSVAQHGDNVGIVSPTPGPAPPPVFPNRANSPFSIRTLVVFFGPILIPKAISYYKSVRDAPRRRGLSVRPLSDRAQLSLGILCAAVLFLAVRSLPLLAPDNIFSRTDSRLQIPVDVLFNRVAALRPAPADGADVLTAQEQVLRAKFVNMESRLLYLRFGPDVLADCPFCTVEDPRSYFYYALPALIWPHVANLVVLAVATSPSLTGSSSSTGKAGGSGAGWRGPATVAALALAALDAYLTGTYNHGANARALRLADADMFFWTSRTARLLALAGLDAVVGTLIFLSATNRAFATPPTPLNRLAPLQRQLLAVRAKMSALAIVRNTAVRDADLRARSNAYWAHEVDLMADIMEERDVVSGVNDALANRISIDEITRDAEAYSRSVLQPLESQD